MSGAMTQMGGIALPIYAVDHATAVITRVQKNLAGMAGPTNTLSGAMTKMARDVNVYGVVSKISHGVRQLGRRALQTATLFSRIAPEFAAFSGGAIGAGIVSLEKRFADLGQRSANVGLFLDIPVERLQAFQGAAKLAGLSAETASAGLGDLDESLRGAIFRFNPMAIQALNKFGVHFGELGKSARNAGDAVYELADGVKRVYETQGRGAALRGLQSLHAESLFPLLVQGGAGVRAFEARARHYGATMTPPMVEESEKLYRSFQDLGLSVIGFANQIGYKLSPAMTDLLHWLAELIQKNAGWLSTTIGNWANAFRDWVQSIKQEDLASVFRVLKDTVQAVVNFPWKDMLQGLEGFGKFLSKWFGSGGSNEEEAYEEAFGLQTAKRRDAAKRMASERTPFGPVLDPERNARSPLLDGGSPQGWGSRRWWMSSPGEEMGGARPGDGPGQPWLKSLWDRITNSTDTSGKSPLLPPKEGTAASGVMQHMHDFFKAKGLNEKEIAAFLVNASAESGFNPEAWDKAHASFGLFQWTQDRLKRLFGKYGEHPSVDQQLAFAWDEPEMRATLRAMHDASTSRADAAEVARRFEGQPPEHADDVIRRANSAKTFEGGLDVNITATGQVTKVETRARGPLNVRPATISPFPTMGLP